MFLTISTTHQPATDLGFLLHKHPNRIQTFSLNFGQAHVFYSEATETRSTVVLLVDIDPIKLTRPSSKSGFVLQPYVNDRPYIASSLMSVAIADVFGSALNGRCKDRPQLVNTPIPLQAHIPVIPSRGGESFIHTLFEPLGYELTVQRHPLDPKFPEWGEGRYYAVTLHHTIRLADLLSHMYVLIPVLDNDKHYWVGQDEVEKLLRHGEGWLDEHPARDQIADRYLRHQRWLVNNALTQLSEDIGTEPSDEEKNAEEMAVEERFGLHQQRLQTVCDQLKASNANRVLDLGCGEGKLLRLLLREKQFTEIIGLDISHRTLKIASQRLRLDQLPPRDKARIRLLHGSLIYRDQRLAGFDAAAVVEVIEHLDPPRLAAFERIVFEFAHPQTVIITTPNREYNVMWPDLPADKFRHRDHRFEWTRAEFTAWAKQVAKTHGYQVQFMNIGPEEEGIGAPSQMGVFEQ